MKIQGRATRLPDPVAAQWPLPRVLPAIVLALAMGSGSCADRGKRTETSASQTAESPQPGLFAVPANQLERLRIKPVQKQDWPVTVRTTGTVDWDADKTSQAITQVTGPIVKILVDSGSLVEAGNPLLYVSSSDVTNAIAACRKARNRMDFETRSLARSKDLLEHRAIAQRDFDSVQADFNDASTDLENALEALRIFGITQQEIEEAERQGLPINPQLAVRLPIKGMVVQKLVFPGQLVQAGATTCFLISDISTVWVQGHIYEKDLTSIGLGDPVEESDSSIPGVFHGVVSFIGAIVDPATRTTPVRIVTRNPKGLLKKDLIVDAIIHTRTKRNVLTVPTSAVLYDADNMPFVYVQAEGGKFAQRQVAIGAQRDDALEVVSGLQEGEKVVAEGAVFLQFANTYQR